MFPTISIGPLAIRTPGLIIILGLWVGIYLAEKDAKTFKFNANKIINLITITGLAGIIGARVFYALKYLDYFIDAPLSFISINPGLLDVYGGLATGLISGLIYMQRQNMSVLPTLDMLTGFFALNCISLSFSNIASGDAYGIISDLPISIELWGAKRFPVQFIYFLFACIIFWIILSQRHNIFIQSEKEGNLFFIFLALCSGSLVFLEPFRESNTLIFNSIRLTQIAAWSVFVISMFSLLKINIKENKTIGE